MNNPPLIGLHEDGEQIGALKTLENGKLTFEGDAESSAQKFFDEVIKLNNAHVKKLENEIESLKQKLKGNMMYMENN